MRSNPFQRIALQFLIILSIAFGDRRTCFLRMGPYQYKVRH